MWTYRQRIALILISLAMLLVLTIRFALMSIYVSDPPPEVGSRANELADKIDPNTADLSTLAALPTLGDKRAKLIIDERDHYRALLPHGGPAFTRPEDLLRVRGIGGATLDQLRPFLMFPSTGPTTRT